MIYKLIAIKSIIILTFVSFELTSLVNVLSKEPSEDGQRSKVEEYIKTINDKTSIKADQSDSDLK